MRKFKQISRHTWTMLSAILVLAGIIMYAYPYIANYVSMKYTYITIESFEKTARSMQTQEDEPETVAYAAQPKEKSRLDKLFEKAEDYNKKLYKNGQKELVDPFSYEVSSFDLADYGIEDNMFGYIELPRLKVIMGIYLGATTLNMSKGAVHLTQTSLPIGGNNTNAVIAAHRGSRYGEMFRNINKLKIGDNIMITNAWDTLTYRVTSTAIIAPDEIDKVLIQEGRDMVTLISCNPYGRHTQRYVVYCDRIKQE